MDLRHDGFQESNSVPSQRQNILGVGVSVANMATAVHCIQDWIDADQRRYVCVTSVHGVMECQRSAELRRIHNAAGMVTPDGMPLVWLLHANGHRESGRVCGPELMPRIVIDGQIRGDRHFLYGSTDEVLQRLKRRFLELAPQARIVGTFAPPFRPTTEAEDAAVVEYINACSPDIVWVGLSTPKQEFWMATHRPVLDAAAIIGVGAAFDIHAGTRRRAPHFLRRSGFEWTWRLLTEPRRLWRRYLVNNPVFVALVVLQLVGRLAPPLERLSSRADLNE
jgi:N-acetylglucosaminyldiphosphoundecaprenol N-acetyl-beta-D-mannosaminyltransferase